MNSLPVCMREDFQQVRPFVVCNLTRGRLPLQGAEPRGNEARDYVDAYVGLDTVHEDAFLMRCPPLNSGVDSRFHVAIDQEGAFWGVLVRRLCEHRDRAIFPREREKKSTKKDGVVTTEKLAKEPDISRVPMFLREEVANLKRTEHFAPRAVLYSQNVTGAPKKAYFVVPLHGRTLLDAAPLLLEDLTRNSTADTLSKRQIDARRIFARNVCYDVWLNLKKLKSSELCHFDLKLDNFFLKMDSSQGLRGSAENALPVDLFENDQSCVFVLGDYGHAVRSGNATELRERTVASGFFQSGENFYKKLLGTFEMAHPDVVACNGDRYDENLPIGQQNARFPVSHNIDRFSAGLMLARAFQSFRLTAEREQVEELLFFEQIQFSKDQGLPNISERQTEGAELALQIYNSNAAVFRRLIRGEPLPTGAQVEIYAKKWERFFDEMSNFDRQVSEMIADLLFLAQNPGQDLQGPQAHELEPFFLLEPSDRAAFCQSVKRIGSFDAATASHLTSLTQNRNNLFRMAHDKRQSILAGNPR